MRSFACAALSLCLVGGLLGPIRSGILAGYPTYAAGAYRFRVPSEFGYGGIVNGRLQIMFNVQRSKQPRADFDRGFARRMRVLDAKGNTYAVVLCPVDRKPLPEYVRWRDYWGLVDLRHPMAGRRAPPLTTPAPGEGHFQLIIDNPSLDGTSLNGLS